MIKNVKPELSEEKLKKIHEISKTVCRVMIYDMNGNCLWDDSNTIKILPREIYVPELLNKNNDWKIDLSSYIARWITPHANCIDEILSRAGVDKGLSGILSGNTNIILQQMKDIYDQLSKEKLTYITRSMSFSEDWYRTQRVCLPSTTMKLRSGNCIDLTVLLASCYESLRFDVSVIMLKDHAFLSVTLGKNHTEYIECTCIGKEEFSTAVEKGYKEFQDNFISSKSEQNYIVNIKHARDSHILPME